MLITIGWATTMYWLTRRWLRQKLAWQWWHEQQALQLHHQAEAIRDGLLQQTFAFRRYLESAEESTAVSSKENSQIHRTGSTATNSAETPSVQLSSTQTSSTQTSSAQTSHWLAQFQLFYQSLESLSNQLSPPFVADSLPLALQFVLNDWAGHQSLAQGDSCSQAKLDLALPADWPLDAPAKNKVVLSIVTALLGLLTEYKGHPRELRLALRREGALSLLTFNLDGIAPQTVQTIFKSPEIEHLKEIFHNLATGRLEISYAGESLTCQLCWRQDSLTPDTASTEKTTLEG